MPPRSGLRSPPGEVTHHGIAAVLAPDGGLEPERLLWLAAVVFIGAVLPVLPTGAAVTSTAVLAEQAPAEIAVVVLCGAVGAWGGDVVTLLLLRWGGGPALERLLRRLSRPGGRTSRVSERLQRHDTRVLVVSRLVPGARIPVLLAAAGGALAPRRYAVHDVAACLLWSVLYAAVGIVGRSIFGSPRVAIVVVVAFVLVVSYAVGLIEDHRVPAQPVSRL